MPLCLSGKKGRINFRMRNYSLNIAGYNIRFESTDSGLDIVPSERFLRFLIPSIPLSPKAPYTPQPPKPKSAPTPPQGGACEERSLTFYETHHTIVIPPQPPSKELSTPQPPKWGAEKTDVPPNIYLPPQPPQGGAEDGQEQQRGADNDLIIRVHVGAKVLPDDAERVFHAPFVEEINGLRIQHNPEFWSIWKYNSDLFIKVVFPVSSNEKQAVLKFSLKTMQWDLWIECNEKQVDPFEYPLDGLILYYLTVINNDIMIHASGINHQGKGYLFSGVSGKGKTTISGLWDNFGAQVIHDDRLILRNTVDGYIMHNTPVYNNDVPGAAPLERIFIIEHGTENKIIPVSGANAVSLVMANCIQHNWGPETVAPLLYSVSDLCGKMKVFKLSFIPDRSVIDSILAYE